MHRSAENLLVDIAPRRTDGDNPPTPPAVRRPRDERIMSAFPPQQTFPATAFGLRSSLNMCGRRADVFNRCNESEAATPKRAGPFPDPPFLLVQREPSVVD